MDTATAAVITTGVLGVAGIAATFFAPTWSQTKLERRRERRSFRRATRLVAHELGLNSFRLGRLAAETDVGLVEFHRSRLLSSSWQAEQALLAESLPAAWWEILAALYQVIDNISQILGNIAAAKGEVELNDEQVLEDARWASENAATYSKQLPTVAPRSD